jgi:predicted PurR-regulated permease PerM
VPPSARHPFFWLATATLLVAIFARAQEVLIPLILALVVAFAMTPAVTLLERWLGRGLAVALVVLAGLGAVSCFGLLVKHQLVDLGSQMTKYSESMRRKVVSLRGGAAGAVDQLTTAVDRVVRNLDKNVNEGEAARPVRVVPAETTTLERIGASIEPVVKPVAKAIIVLVLVVFLLAKREDLRDRLIRLLGRRNVSLTTRTLDEAGRRIGRFLVTQSVINGAFGVAVAIALSLIGVPYAPLWGFFAAVLRFVPFLGTILGMLLPALMAFAQLPGWWPSLATVGVFLGLDLLVAYAIEPMVIGRKTGVSSTAMIVAAIFWTWLWGPVGLLLSTPLTVCLAVLGRQMPRLEFLAVLLGDEPALDADLALYQRLLARDEDEGADILERSLKTSSRNAVLDDLLVPVVLAAERESAAGAIGEADHDEILRTVRALVSSLPADEAVAPPSPLTPSPQRRILGVPARNAAEELLLELFIQRLDPARFEISSAGTDALVSEVVTSISEGQPIDLVCITSLPPGGLAQVRYLCKRLRARRPDLSILVLRVGVPPEGRDSVRALTDDGASNVAFTLAEANQIAERLFLTEATPVPVPVAGEPAGAVLNGT